MWAYLVDHLAEPDEWDLHIKCHTPQLVCDPDAEYLHLTTNQFRGDADVLITNARDETLLRYGPYKVSHGCVVTDELPIAQYIVSKLEFLACIDNVINVDPVYEEYGSTMQMLSCIGGVIFLVFGILWCAGVIGG